MHAGLILRNSYHVALADGLWLNSMDRNLKRRAMRKVVMGNMHIAVNRKIK